MKVPLYFIGLLLFLFSCKPVETKTDVQKEQLVACETGKSNCRPITVIRQNTGAKTVVRFLIGNRNMRMQLFDATYPTQINIVHEENIKPVIANFFEEEEYPAFDLTPVPDGKYYIHIIGDEVGGIFELNLKTKN